MPGQYWHAPPLAHCPRLLPLRPQREYFSARTAQNDVPAQLSNEDRIYYRALFNAIDREDWASVQQMLGQRTDGPLHAVAIAEYYLAARSPRVELPQIEQWLRSGRTLPQAEQLTRLGLTRGLTQTPDLPQERSFYRQPSAPKRIRPSSIEDGTMPAAVSAAILERITNDDPDGARLLLDGIDAALSPAARAEWRQRVAWSYYIENQDPAALAIAQTISQSGAGPWVAEGEWVVGLAAWRLGDCRSALSGFENAAQKAANAELGAAASYWANRAAIRCRMPERAAHYLRQAATQDETLYGMLAAEQLGMSLPAHYARPDFSKSDWNRLQGDQNIRIAVALAEIGRDDLASEVLIHQAKIGDPGDYEAMCRLARSLGLPSTQLYMAYNTPRGGKSDPASRYPTPKWQPVTGWQVDPALAYAHALQESNFRTTAVSPANAQGVMQITPITVRAARLCPQSERIGRRPHRSAESISRSASKTLKCCVIPMPPKASCRRSWPPTMLAFRQSRGGTAKCAIAAIRCSTWSRSPIGKRAATSRS